MNEKMEKKLAKMFHLKELEFMPTCKFASCKIWSSINHHLLIEATHVLKKMGILEEFLEDRPKMDTKVMEIIIKHMKE